MTETASTGTTRDDSQYLQLRAGRFQSRVGQQYQVDDKQLQLSARVAKSLDPSAVIVINDDEAADNDNSIAGQVRYSYRAAQQNISAIDDYLHHVHALFHYLPHAYDDEQALYLLHCNDYDIPSTLSMLQPLVNTLNTTEVDISKPTAISKHNDEVEKQRKKRKLDVSSSGSDSESDSQPKQEDEECLICNEGGELIICDYPTCSRVYHLLCVGLQTLPTDDWYCPSHYCEVCEAEVEAHSRFVCKNCTTAYCNYHIPKNATATDGHHSNLMSATENPHLIQQQATSNTPLPPFLCNRCSGREALSQSANDRYTFLRQLMSLMTTFTSQHQHTLLQLYCEIQNRGGLSEMLNSNRWKELQSWVQTMGKDKLGLKAAPPVHVQPTPLVTGAQVAQPTTAPAQSTLPSQPNGIAPSASNSSLSRAAINVT